MRSLKNSNAEPTHGLVTIQKEKKKCVLAVEKIFIYREKRYVSIEELLKSGGYKVNRFAWHYVLSSCELEKGDKRANKGTTSNHRRKAYLHDLSSDVKLLEAKLKNRLPCPPDDKMITESSSGDESSNNEEDDDVEFEMNQDLIQQYNKKLVSRNKKSQSQTTVSERDKGTGKEVRAQSQSRSSSPRQNRRSQDVSISPPCPHNNDESGNTESEDSSPQRSHSLKSPPRSEILGRRGRSRGRSNQRRSFNDQGRQQLRAQSQSRSRSRSLSPRQNRRSQDDSISPPRPHNNDESHNTESDDSSPQRSHSPQSPPRSEILRGRTRSNDQGQSRSRTPQPSPSSTVHSSDYSSTPTSSMYRAHGRNHRRTRNNQPQSQRQINGRQAAGTRNHAQPVRVREITVRQGYSQKLISKSPKLPRGYNLYPHGRMGDSVPGDPTTIYIGLDIYIGHKVWDRLLRIRKFSIFVREMSSIIWTPIKLVNRAFNLEARNIDIKINPNSPRKRIEAEKLQLLRDAARFYCKSKRYTLSEINTNMETINRVIQKKN